MIGVPIGEIMKRGVVTAKKTDTVKHVANVFKKTRIGRVVVLDKKKIVGILTERDIIHQIVAVGKSIKTPISKIMSYPVKTITPEEDIGEAIKTMNKYDISGLPVTSNGHLVGIVTERDLISAEPGLLELMKEKGNLEHISTSDKDVSLSGECDECKNWSDTLKLVEGRFLCEDCR
jgi:CBS domain-containing protein